MNDAKALPIGISDFSDLVKNDFQLVDKSLFIKAVMNDSALAIVITRPSGFGRTVNLSMLKYFLLNDKQYKNLFNDLAITKDKEFCQKYQNRYPVIYLSFKNVSNKSFQNSFNDIQKIISELYAEHDYLLQDLSEYEAKYFTKIINKSTDKIILGHSLKYLTRYLSNKFGQHPILLIDDYDVPFQEAYLGGYYEEMVYFMRSILGSAIKDNSFLGKAIILGTTRISANSLDSQMNNIWVATMLSDHYSQFFGFTENEVATLIKNSNLPSINIINIRKWYGNYHISKKKLYHPFSVIKCLNNLGKLEAYWPKESNIDALQLFFKQTPPGLKYLFVSLLKEEPLTLKLDEGFYFPDMAQYTEEFLLLLYYNGYLQVISSELIDGRTNVTLAIANQETAKIYNEIIRELFPTINEIVSLKELVNSLYSNVIEEFRLIFTAYMSELEKAFISTIKPLEQVISCLILGLTLELQANYLVKLDYTSSHNIKMLFIPKSKGSSGIILLFSIVEIPALLEIKAQESLNIIKFSEDTQDFKQHFIQNESLSVLVVSLAFWEKQLVIISENISLKSKTRYK